ncbi:MAG: MFS transporter [Chloroflexi bacterium]|nr:MAG: MFS transporter [Chloroflexota bacterium]
MRFLREDSPAPRAPLRLAILPRALKEAYQCIPDLVRQMSRPLKALALVVVLSFIAQAMVGSFWVVYVVELTMLSTAEWGLILLVESVIRTVLFIPAGLLVDRWGRKTTLVVALVISSLATPAFVLVHGFIPILLVRGALAVAFVLGLLACMALMADLVPRSVRGQMMAAIGQGGIMLGAVGVPGGPSVGYLAIPPLMVASLAGGYLYLLNPVYPWICATAAGLLSVGLALGFIRDPRQAEI